MDSKFQVPCEPDKMLNIYYGDDWTKPMQQSYKINNQILNEKINRTLEDIPHSFRYYYNNGTVDIERSIQRINKYYFPLTGKNITVLPPSELE